MIPVPGKTLADIAVRVATNLAADARSAYGQADGGMISALLLTLAEDFERAVFNRMTDIDEIKSLCARYPQAGDKLSDPNTAKALADKTPASLMLADVTQLHAEAFDLLIELHAWAELHDEALNQDIWALLRRHSERNKFTIPGP